MNDEQLNKLFAAARQSPPDTARAEFGFETRLTACLRQEQSSWAWRLVPVFAAIVLALGIWNYVSFRTSATDLGSAIAGGQAEQLVAAHLGGE